MTLLIYSYRWFCKLFLWWDRKRYWRWAAYMVDSQCISKGYFCAKASPWTELWQFREWKSWYCPAGNFNILQLIILWIFNTNKRRIGHYRNSNIKISFFIDLWRPQFKKNVRNGNRRKQKRDVLIYSTVWGKWTFY